MALEPDCRGRGPELHYQAWLAFREFFLYFYYHVYLQLLQLLTHPINRFCPFELFLTFKVSTSVTQINFLPSTNH